MKTLLEFLPFIAAFAGAIGVALCASPWLLRETQKDAPTRRIRLRFRELGGRSRIPDIFVKPFAGDSLGVIASRRLCFGLLVGAITVTAATILPAHSPGVVLGLTILTPAARAKSGLVDRWGNRLDPDHPIMNAVRAQASANPTLTNFAVGLAQDMTRALAEFLSPTCEVPSTVGQFKRFDDKNAFQTYNTARAVGGRATRIEFETSDATYNCKPQALEVPVDDSERDAADASDPIKLDESKIKTLISVSTLSHETKVIDATINAISAEAVLGVWSDATKDPVEELDGLIEAISNATGMMPNRLAIGIGAWKAFRNHPKVRARQPGAELIGLTPGQAAAMLLNPEIQIKIGTLSRDTTKFGKAKNAVNVVGAKLLLFIASDNPTQYDPSFSKTFTGRRGGVTAVRTYREEGARSDIHAVDWSEDIQITGTACGRRVDIS